MAKRKAAKKRAARKAGRSRRPAPRAKARPRRRAPKAKVARRAARPVRKAAARPKARPPRRAIKKPAPRRARAAAPRPAAAAPPPKGVHAARPPVLERERRRLSDVERSETTSLTDDRLLSAARSGHDDLAAELSRHTETSPKLTAGDIDARWQDAYAVGDEAPGGDNPTPGQDRVDAIGRALGINYRDDEELRGGEEVTERDKHRWELDPASSDDWPDGHER
jgi:hypothetical protein